MSNQRRDFSPPSLRGRPVDCRIYRSGLHSYISGSPGHCMSIITSKKSQRELAPPADFSPKRANTPRRDTHSNPPDLARCPAERRRNPRPSPKRTRSWRTRYVSAHPRPFHNSQNYASRPRATAAARDRGADPAQAARGAANRRRRLMIFHWIDDGDAPRCNLTRGLTPDLGMWPRAPAPIITIIS